MLTKKDYETAKRDEKRLIRARNKATFLIEDAMARYVKNQTKAKSKKIATEKDALLASEKYKCLNLYDRVSDIQEAYGIGAITEEAMFRYEALWEERENIRKKVDDTGHYSDDVIKALHEALYAIADIWEDDIEKAKETIKMYENGEY